MKEFKNVCVLKVFEPDEKTIAAIEKAAEGKGVWADVKLVDGDCSITVASERDEVAFNDAVKDIFAICGDKLYSDSGESLAEKAVETLSAAGKTVSVARRQDGQRRRIVHGRNDMFAFGGRFGRERSAL